MQLPCLTNPIYPRVAAGSCPKAILDAYSSVRRGWSAASSREYLDGCPFSGPIYSSAWTRMCKIDPAWPHITRFTTHKGIGRLPRAPRAGSDIRARFGEWGDAQWKIAGEEIGILSRWSGKYEARGENHDTPTGSRRLHTHPPGATRLNIASLHDSPLVGFRARPAWY